MGEILNPSYIQRQVLCRIKRTLCHHSIVLNMPANNRTHVFLLNVCPTKAKCYFYNLHFQANKAKQCNRETVKYSNLLLNSQFLLESDSTRGLHSIPHSICADERHLVSTDCYYRAPFWFLLHLSGC